MIDSCEGCLLRLGAILTKLDDPSFITTISRNVNDLKPENAWHFLLGQILRGLAQDLLKDFQGAPERDGKIAG